MQPPQGLRNHSGSTATVFADQPLVGLSAAPVARIVGAILVGTLTMNRTNTPTETTMAASGATS